jgi:hypothetical protein
LIADSSRGEVSGSTLREGCVVEGTIKLSKGKGAGWYVRVQRIVVDERFVGFLQHLLVLIQVHTGVRYYCPG